MEKNMFSGEYVTPEVDAYEFLAQETLCISCDTEPYEDGGTWTWD